MSDKATDDSPGWISRLFSVLFSVRIGFMIIGFCVFLSAVAYQFSFVSIRSMHLVGDFIGQYGPVTLVNRGVGWVSEKVGNIAEPLRGWFFDWGGDGRLGRPERATFIPRCQVGVRTTRDTYKPLLQPELVKDPETFMRVLENRIEAVTTDFIGPIYETRRDDARWYTVTMATFGGDFVACALSQSAVSLCQPHNRAAAVTFTNRYFSGYMATREIFRDLGPLQKDRVEPYLFPARHAAIEASLERHAKAGVLRASDFGSDIHPRIRSLLASYAGVADSCAPSPRS